MADEFYERVGERQRGTMEVLDLLLKADRDERRTVQFMPQSPGDCKVEVITADGDLEHVVEVQRDGALRLRPDQVALAQPLPGEDASAGR